MFAASTILYKMIVCLSESRGGSSFGESIFSYCGQRYWWFDPADDQCFVFCSHIFFSLRFFLRLPLYNTFRLD